MISGQGSLFEIDLSPSARQLRQVRIRVSQHLIAEIQQTFRPWAATKIECFHILEWMNWNWDSLKRLLRELNPHMVDAGDVYEMVIVNPATLSDEGRRVKRIINEVRSRILSEGLQV